MKHLIILSLTTALVITIVLLGIVVYLSSINDAKYGSDVMIQCTDWGYDNYEMNPFGFICFETHTECTVSGICKEIRNVSSINSFDVLYKYGETK